MVGGGERGTRGGSYGISALSILPGYALREARREQEGDVGGFFGRDVQGCGAVAVAGDAGVFVAGVYEEILG